MIETATEPDSRAIVEAAGSPQPTPPPKPARTISPADAALLDAFMLFRDAMSVAGHEAIPSERVLAWMLKHAAALSAAGAAGAATAEVR